MLKFCSKALSGNEVCTLLYADEYREEYEHFTGEDTRNTGGSFYTTNEQISRYSKRLAFWKIKLNELGEYPEFYTPDGITSYSNKRMFFMGNVDQVRFRIENNFTNEIKVNIHEAAYKLEVSTRNNIYNGCIYIFASTSSCASSFTASSFTSSFASSSATSFKSSFTY